MTASARFVTAPAAPPGPTTPLARPRSATATSATTSSSSAVAVIGTLPGTRPVPARRPASRAGGLGGRAARLFRALAGLLRTGGTRAGQMSAQSRRVIAYLVVATIVAVGDQVDIADPVTAPDPAELRTGADVTTAEQVLQLAAAEIGTVEGAGGATPYHRAYGIAAREPWCAVFLWAVFQNAGGADSIGPKTASTPTMAGWFRAQGRWSRTPVVGAIVFYDWPDRTYRIQHVEIVESFTATTITTIGGNTSAGPRGSQSNGDGVYRRTRSRDDSVEGFGLPVYGLPL